MLHSMQKLTIDRAGLAGGIRFPGRRGPASGLTWKRASRDAFVLVAIVWTVAIALGVSGWTGIDARAYFDARLPSPYAYDSYAAGSAANAGFFYSPAVALALAPLQQLGWPLFQSLIAALTFAGLLAILGRWAFLALLFPPVWWDISSGNINTLIGCVAVLGLRWPALWAFALLTKITPGVGVLWFAFRREWRSLAVALGVTTALAAMSAVLAPALWSDWVALLVGSTGYTGPGYFTIPVPLLPRLAAAVVLLAWAAPRNHRWALPLAVVLGMPVLWYPTLAPLVALTLLQRRTAGERFTRRAASPVRAGRWALRSSVSRARVPLLPPTRSASPDGMP
jgi:hypothetical protein